MALTKETKVDKIEVLEDGQLQVREATIIMDDGKEISRTFHRYVLDPARDTDNLSDKDSRVQDIANTVWTEEVVLARQDALKPSPTDGESKLVVD